MPYNDYFLSQIRRRQFEIQECLAELEKEDAILREKINMLYFVEHWPHETSD
jgi:hypothetical protein